MNPEQAAIRSLDSRRRVDDIKDCADSLLVNHSQIERVMQKIAIDPNDFRDLYGDKSVDDDLRYVKNMKERFAETANREVTNGLTEGDVRKLAERSEYEIIRGINTVGWLPLVRGYKTAEKDDIDDGIDLALEVTDKKLFGHLGLGVDVTFSNNVDGKFARVKDEIERYDGNKNQLARIKYYKSPNTGFRGELNQLCRVVIAVDLPMLKDMANTKTEGLHDHIARHELLLEIEQQLAVFIDYALRVNPPAAKPIQRTQHFVNQIITALKSKHKIEQAEYGKNRKANEAIQRGLMKFK